MLLRACATLLVAAVPFVPAAAALRSDTDVVVRARRPWTTLEIDKDVTVPSNETIPSDTHVRFVNGGCFVVAAGATLRIEGSMDAPLQQVFAGDGAVRLGTKIARVHPEWFGAVSTPMSLQHSRQLLHVAPQPARHRHHRAPVAAVTVSPSSSPIHGDENALAIQQAIDSVGSVGQDETDGNCQGGGEIYFSPGIYDLGSTGVSVGTCTTLSGANAGASTLLFSGTHGSAITLDKDTAWFHLSKLSIHGTRTQGFGINGTAEYVRYFSIRDFGVIGFSTGIYIQAGEHLEFGFGYMSAYSIGEGSTPSKGAPGTYALKLGKCPPELEAKNECSSTSYGCTTVTIQDIYFTQADILIYTISAPQVIIRPIFEECRVGIQSYSRGIVVGPFSDNPSCDVLANLTNNGMYFVGFPEGQHPIHFAGQSEMARSSIMPDTFDGPMRLGLLRMGFDNASHGLSNLTIDGRPV